MMRHYLRRLWRATAGDNEITDTIVKDFTDELAEQYESLWKSGDQSGRGDRATQQELL